MQHTLYQIGVLSDPCCFSSGSEQLSRQGLLSSSGMPQNIQEGLLSSSGTPQILLENLTSVLYITYDICNIDISVVCGMWSLHVHFTGEIIFMVGRFKEAKS